jgi:hypothetical protein
VRTEEVRFSPDDVKAPSMEGINTVDIMHLKHGEVNLGVSVCEAAVAGWLGSDIT